MSTILRELCRAQWRRTADLNRVAPANIASLLLSADTFESCIQRACVLRYSRRIGAVSLPRNLYGLCLVLPVVAVARAAFEVTLVS